MTTQEFSDQFDILYNNINSAESPGINEYEKSVFLTKAEKQIVREYFERGLNRSQAGFDDSIKRQYDFSSLVKTTELYNISHHWNNDNLSLGQDTFNLDGIPFILPLDYYLTVNELITDKKSNKYSVLPLTYEEYQLRQAKPFPFPNKREAWRILNNQRDINSGYKNIRYIHNNSEDEYYAKVECCTTFASEGKNMKFTLSHNNEIKNELDGLIENGLMGAEIQRVYESFDDTDYYVNIKRVENYHDLEHIMMSVGDASNSIYDLKLYDNDYVLNYSFNGVIDKQNTMVDCIYQKEGAMAITSVTVVGEGSALGALRIYMHLTEDLENESIGHDPYTLIARISFTHWEEGKHKEKVFVIWNGGWGHDIKEVTYSEFTTTKLIESNDESNYPIYVFSNLEKEKKITIGLAISKSGDPYNLTNVISKTINPNNSNTVSLANYKGQHVVGYFVTGYTSDGIPMDDYELFVKHGIKYKNNLNDAEYTEVEVKFPYTPTTIGIAPKGNAKRLDCVNVRHWDYADNFDWPQRIKIENLYDSEVNPIFSIEMSPSTAPAVEIVGKFKGGGIQSYMMRYVSKPKPIILEDLATTDLSIDGYTEVMECELPEECHEEILERAVTLAKLAYGGSSATLARANNNQ